MDIDAGTIRASPINRQDDDAETPITVWADNAQTVSPRETDQPLISPAHSAPLPELGVGLAPLPSTTNINRSHDTRPIITCPCPKLDPDISETIRCQNHLYTINGTGHKPSTESQNSYVQSDGDNYSNMNNGHTVRETDSRETNGKNADMYDPESAEQTDNTMTGKDNLSPVFFSPNDNLPIPRGPDTPSGVMMHGDRQTKRAKSGYGKGWNQAWCDFCENTTVHGLRQIAEIQPYMIRRLIWIAIVLAGLAMFLYQMISGIMYYYTYPVSVNVKINYNDTIGFPALTICNQNAFRKTVADDNDWYFLLSDMFSGTDDISDIDLARYNASDLELYEIYNIAGHAKEDLIVRCVWDGHPCDLDEFKTTMTDYGKCYTFNANPNTIRNASRTGTDGGLRLLVNIEQYEYMPGPNQGAGLRVHLHSQNEAPLVRDFGIAMPPGSYSLLGMTMIRIQNLPYPHGQCDNTRTLEYFDTYSKTNCLEECKQKYLEDNCNCKHINMVNNSGSMPYCDLFNYQNCVLPTFNMFNLDRSWCDCPIPCDMESLEMFNSLGDISGFDALSLLNSPLTQELEDRYVISNEVTQRVNRRIVDNDRQMVERLGQSVEALEVSLGDIVVSLDYLDQYIDDMFAVFDQRINFHKVKGLDKVQYIMEHDFVRGWTIIDERTLPYLSFGFYELRGSYRRIIQNLRDSQNGTEQERTIALAMWKQMENTLLERLDIYRRAYDNVTEVHEHYKSGHPLLTYRSSLNRRYDMTWITLQILHAIIDDDTHNQDKFYETLVMRMNQINQTTHTYLDMGRTFRDTYEIDYQLWDDTDWLYRKGCVQYNYHVFLYKERIIDGPVNIIKEKIKEFDLLNRTMEAAKESLLLARRLLGDHIQEAKTTHWATIRGALNDSLTYLNDTATNKTHLAATFTSKNMLQTIKDLELFFSSLRSGGQVIQEKIQALHYSVENMWTNMLTEYSTAKFYAKVYEDFVAFHNNSEFYLPYFAELLGVDSSDLQNVSNAVLEYRLNADFAVTDVEDKSKSIQETFTNLDYRMNIARMLSINDENFAVSIDTYKNSLEDFLDQTEIDVEFYQKNFIQVDIYMQELSYEEILQQPAYDTLNLFGDIGGSIGLFLGASALTVAEILDVFILQMIRLGQMQ